MRQREASTAKDHRELKSGRSATELWKRPNHRPGDSKETPSEYGRATIRQRKTSGLRGTRVAPPAATRTCKGPKPPHRKAPALWAAAPLQTASARREPRHRRGTHNQSNNGRRERSRSRSSSRSRPHRESADCPRPRRPTATRVRHKRTATRETA